MRFANVESCKRDVKPGIGGIFYVNVTTKGKNYYPSFPTSCIEIIYVLGCVGSFASSSYVSVIELKI